MSEQPELGLTGTTVPKLTVHKATRICDLLQKATSLPVVSNFLKKKGVHFSAGSWEEMREKRILPAVKRGVVTLPELRDLLSEAEEYDRSHVFLFKYNSSRLRDLLDREKVAARCKKLGLTEALEGVVVEEHPKVATVTEIREESGPPQKWIFKVVETRQENVYVGESLDEEGLLVKRWKPEDTRAVNVARLHGDGLLELSIYSQRSSNDYAPLISSFWELLESFLPQNDFSDFSLSKAKRHLWEQRAKLKGRVRFSDSKLKNTSGTTILASAGAVDANLMSDVAAAASVDHFLKGGAYCEASNLWLSSPSGVIDREVHVLLPSRNNEFALTASCTRREYDYVLNELRTHNL